MLTPCRPAPQYSAIRRHNSSRCYPRLLPTAHRLPQHCQKRRLLCLTLRDAYRHSRMWTSRQLATCWSRMIYWSSRHFVGTHGRGSAICPGIAWPAHTCHHSNPTPFCSSRHLGACHPVCRWCLLGWCSSCAVCLSLYSMLQLVHHFSNSHQWLCFHPLQMNRLRTTQQSR